MCLNTRANTFDERVLQSERVSVDTHQRLLDLCVVRDYCGLKFVSLS